MQQIAHKRISGVDKDVRLM